MFTNAMPCIGRGAFSTVYRKSRNKVLIKSRDRVKECMSLGWFPKATMFPTITHVATSADGKWKFYEERFYQRTQGLKKHLDPFEWEFYQELRKLFCNWHRGFKNWHDEFERLPAKFNHRKKKLQEACMALQNYDPNPRFEISPRNVAVHNRKLVLLDCFYIYD